MYSIIHSSNVFIITHLLSSLVQHLVLLLLGRLNLPFPCADGPLFKRLLCNLPATDYTRSSLLLQLLHSLFAPGEGRAGCHLQAGCLRHLERLVVNREWPRNKCVRARLRQEALHNHLGNAEGLAVQAHHARTVSTHDGGTSADLEGKRVGTRVVTRLSLRVLRRVTAGCVENQAVVGR